AEREPGVLRAQILVNERRGRVSSVEVLLLAAPGAPEGLAVRLREDLMSSTFTLSTAFQHDPGSFRVTVTDALVGNERTGKTASFVVREEP
ncbi:hypothetical protein ACFQ08_36765, partial [Streptosporangium algeriense]